MSGSYPLSQHNIHAFACMLLPDRERVSGPNHGHRPDKNPRTSPWGVFAGGNPFSLRWANSYRPEGTRSPLIFAVGRRSSEEGSAEVGELFEDREARNGGSGWVLPVSYAHKSLPLQLLFRLCLYHPMAIRPIPCPRQAPPNPKSGVDERPRSASPGPRADWFGL